MRYFEARLSRFSLIYTGALLALMAGTIGFLLYQRFEREVFGVLIALAVILSVGLFSVRGYEIEARTLRIKRPLWTTEVDLGPLTSVEPAPFLAKSVSISLWSTRGFFGLVGFFYKRGIGVYHAYVTDLRNAVLLRFQTGMPIVVSPDAPPKFVEAVLEATGLPAQKGAPSG